MTDPSKHPLCSAAADLGSRLAEREAVLGHLRLYVSVTDWSWLWASASSCRKCLLGRTGGYRPCSLAAPRYVVTCAPVGGSTNIDISFSRVIGPNQWVAVTLRMPLPFLPGGATWTTDQNELV